jgi:hypothetical protein
MDKQNIAIVKKLIGDFSLSLIYPPSDLSLQTILRHWTDGWQ